MLYVIMGLGLVASAGGIIKLVRITEWATTKDPTWDLAPLLLWAYFEENTAIMAASIPCLKSLFQSTAQRAITHLPWTKGSKTDSSGEFGGFSTPRKPKAKSLNISTFDEDDGGDLESPDWQIEV
jgi:hypothetical protein